VIGPQRVSPPHVVHVVEVKPGDELGGTELHVADLAGHQLEAGDLRPLVLCLGSRALLPRLALRGVCAVHLTARDLAGGLQALRVAMAPTTVAVLHSHGGRANGLAALLLATRARQRPGTAFVITAHGAVVGRPGHRRHAAVEPRLDRADRIIAVSAPEAEVLAQRHGSARVTYIPNGVRRPGRLLDRSRRRPAQRMVGFIGRLSPEKRPDLFLDMAARLTGDGSRVRFVVAGGGPERQRLERQRSDLDLDDCVDLVGFVDDPWQLLAELDVLVCPSDTEGSPRIVLEAMASGVPVVATAVGGVPHVIRGGSEGVVVAPGDPGALAVAVAELLRRPDARRRLAEAAQDRFRRDFTLEMMARRVGSVYREVNAG